MVFENFYHGVIGSSSAQIGAFIDTLFASFLALVALAICIMQIEFFNSPTLFCRSL